MIRSARLLRVSHSFLFYWMPNSTLNYFSLQYHVTPTEQRKINGDVGQRRLERRRMREKLKVAPRPAGSRI
jgi:hypothetical protein